MRDIIEGYLGITPDNRKSRLPAKLDRWQSITGLILALFIIGHMFFTSSILLGKDAMYFETKIFEGGLFLDEPQPIIVSIAVVIIFTIFILHAALAMRKFPRRYREYKLLKTHTNSIAHLDTKLWMIQAITGFAMFFLGSVHLYLMMTIPDKIGPYASADRIYSDRMVILYALLMISVILHAMIGLYRLAIKWGVPTIGSARGSRKLFKGLMWIAIIFFTLLGYSALATYYKIGYEHRDKYGQRYIPSNIKGEMK